MALVDQKNYEIIVIALVSPGDVAEERKLANEVADNLNKYLAKALGILIELRQWEDAYPALHPLGPQGRIDSQLNIPECHLVVGIFWRRLGTPTVSGMTGAEHEIQTAYDAWIGCRKPQVMLYFNNHVFFPPTVEDAKQLEMVLEFKERFKDTGLRHDYDGPQMFEQDFRNHLTKLIAERVNARGPTITVVPCFASTSPSYVRREGMAELVSEVALLFATSPIAQPTTCNVIVSLNTSITNTIAGENRLVDVFLSSKNASSGPITRFQGRRVGDFRVQFDNVVIDLEGPIGTREYTISGLRANALRLAGNSSALGDTHVIAWIQIEGSTERLIHVVNPTVNVGIVNSHPYFLAWPTPVATFSRTTGVNSSFASGQPGARPEVSFRVRFEEPYFGTFTTAAEEARYRYIAEPSTPPTGIRFWVRFLLPSNIRLYVTTRDINSGNPTLVSAALIRANDAGAGTAEPIPPDCMTFEALPIAPIDVVDGVAYATWEWVRTRTTISVKVPRRVEFGIVIVAAPNEASVGQWGVEGSFAPLGFSLPQHISQMNASPDAPVPRFGHVRGPVPAFTITSE
jgi:hypothetical protein